MDYDVELMAQTSERISEGLAKQLESLIESHGSTFAANVMGNVGIYLLTGLLASSKDDESRLLTLISVIHSLSVNVKIEMAGYEADQLLERLKKGAKC
jgi:hypothetical protein